MPVLPQVGSCGTGSFPGCSEAGNPRRRLLHPTANRTYQIWREPTIFEDKTLVCRDCGKEFVFTASEQQFFADKGFQNDPTRCHECRVARRNRENPNRAERQMYEVICDGCGCTTQVPFQPKGDRPVYCRECFERNRNQQY